MNIYDIAREAGVSIATVSRVLNHKDIVRADTRAKVEKVLKRCNYAPSAIAQGMVSKSLHTVAVLTVDIRDSHYARTAYTIEREFGRRGYEVILCNTGGDRAETLRTLQGRGAEAGGRPHSGRLDFQHHLSGGRDGESSAQNARRPRQRHAGPAGRVLGHGR